MDGWVDSAAEKKKEKLTVCFFSLSNRLCGSPQLKASTVQCTVPPTCGTESGSSLTLLIMTERLVSYCRHGDTLNLKS